MAIGETLLKLTDYPFTYSLGFLAIGVYGYNISDDRALSFLTAAGILGTFLAIVDPFGWIVGKYYLLIAYIEYRRLKLKNEIINDWNYLRSAFYTKSMSLEKDRMVGIVYFVITLFTFVAAITQSETFANRFVIKTSFLNCELTCVQEYGWIILVSFASVLCLKIGFDSTKLTKKADIVATYLSSINLASVPKESVTAINSFIELGDWKTAEHWKEKIREDIKYNRGKRDIIIKATDLVYTPLYRTTVDFQNNIRGMKYSRRFPSYDVKEWQTIKINSKQSLIEETDLRGRIESFYELVSKYDEFMGTVNRKAEQIINQRASEIYDKNVRRIDYDVESPQGSGTVELFGCALFDVPPLDNYNVRGRLRSLRVEFINEKQETQYANFNDTTLFDKMWELVRSDTKKDPDIMKMHKYFDEIKKENEELSRIFSEKIAMQLKV